ncbi:MAG: hypothetical protein K2M00_07625, partial [Muribaculaceae bacterium]|nr:hypothetical protein [Muribaculaceae bacterium]
MKMRFFTVLLSITLCAVLIRGDELSPLLNNCIITYMPRTAIKSADFNDDVADGNVRISIDHFDGLGRPTGKVLVGEGGGGEDLATLTIYNRRNLPCKQWQVMPFASNGGVLPAENLFSGACGQLYGDGEIGYTETEYEKLPSSRPASVRGPGINWKKKPVTSDYSINTDKNTCLHFTVYEDYITNTGAYPSGSLKVVTVTSADGAETTEFRNAYDKPVCVRRRIDANTCADTYYVYDNRGLLRVVLQPMASETFTTTRTSPMELDADLFRQYAFVYTYDIAGRVYTSRNPGQDEVRYVYDVMGHLTMKQDGVQRQSNTWTVIK